MNTDIELLKECAISETKKIPKGEHVINVLDYQTKITEASSEIEGKFNYASILLIRQNSLLFHA